MSDLNFQGEQPRPRFAPPYCCGPYPKPQPQPAPKRRCHCPKPRCCDPCGFDSCCSFGMKKTVIPAVLGDDSEGSDYAPYNGMYCNMLVEYEANGAVYVYTSDGIYTRIKDGRKEA